jgi:hypothetical protein
MKRAASKLGRIQALLAGRKLQGFWGHHSTPKIEGELGEKLSPILKTSLMMQDRFSKMNAK